MVARLIAVLAIGFSAPLSAQQTIRGDFSQADAEKYISLMGEMGFSISLNTPDVLDPLVIPYTHCMFHQAGVIFRDSQGSVREPEIQSQDCHIEREQVMSEGPAILTKDGLTSKDLQQNLLRRIVATVDYAAKVQAADPTATQDGGDSSISVDGAESDEVK